MALNQRQIDHFEEAQLVSKLAHLVAYLGDKVNNDHNEEFKTGSTRNPIADADLLALYFVKYTDYATFCGQFCGEFPKMWTNQDSAVRNYANEARKVWTPKGIKLPNILI